jgi:hypothetical protein
MIHATVTEALNAAHIAELHRQAAVSRDVAAAGRGGRRFVPAALRRLRRSGSRRSVLTATGGRGTADLAVGRASHVTVWAPRGAREEALAWRLPESSGS